ncbi:MAG TPA: RpoL/Rpb11 RNA polymerase subunit family protein [Patescibacteria group bacterium]|nr:RpoL/Rpb11 RNA polymerase subunit family protein [Patescibacteria group bacterium]
MELKILESSKNELKAELENVTLAEILRVYLNKDSDVSFVAWKREHITKKPIISVKTKGKTVKKAVADAVDKITKDLDKIEADFKKLK